MITIKKGPWLRNIGVVLAGALLAGCGPQGARDLRHGERLIEAGHCDEAIAPLKNAVEVLSGSPDRVQARALNLLGLAYAGTGQFDDASQVYAQALKLDRDNAAIDYNLGCLRMAQGNIPGAIDYLTTYEALRPRDAQGHLRMGEARFHYALQHSGSERARQLENARREFEAAEAAGGTASALNSLGLVELAWRNAGNEAIRNAANDFQNALKSDPHYGPALLNLAIVQQEYFKQPREALRNYQAYLALQPNPPRAKDVEKIAHQLDLDSRITITPQGQEQPTLPPQTRNYTPPSTSPAQPRESPAPPKIVRAPAPEPVIKSQPSYSAPSPQPSLPPSSPLKSEEVAESVSPSRPSQPVPAEASNNSPPLDQATEMEPAPPPSGPLPHKSLVQKLNPLHWFSGKAKEPDVALDGRSKQPLPTVLPGDRPEAQRLAQQGVEARHQGRLTEAISDYQKAVDADPTYFDARLLLGLSAIDNHNYATAMTALAGALRLRPDSSDARYAFAWTLQKSGYTDDAARELERLVEMHPEQVRAHLLLGNLYAETLGKPKQAREQYETALALDPRNSQADALRKWLIDHP